MADRVATIYDYARFMRNYCVNTRCNDCQLSVHNNETDVPCKDFVRQYPCKANEIILKWCDENPVRTYKDDFLEKFPNATVASDNHPGACRQWIYGQKNCRECCTDCWNEAMPE